MGRISKHLKTTFDLRFSSAFLLSVSREGLHLAGLILQINRSPGGSRVQIRPHPNTPEGAGALRSPSSHDRRRTEHWSTPPLVVMSLDGHNACHPCPRLLLDILLGAPIDVHPGVISRSGSWLKSLRLLVAHRALGPAPHRCSLHRPGRLEHRSYRRRIQHPEGTNRG